MEQFRRAMSETVVFLTETDHSYFPRGQLFFFSK